MHPYYGKENASIPTGVEVREDLDEMNVGKILRYTKPDVTADYWSVSISESESIYNPARNLSYIYWICWCNTEIHITSIVNTLRMPWINSTTSTILIWTKKKNTRTKKNTETVMTGTTSTIKIYTGTIETIKIVETRKTTAVIMKTRTISMGTIWIAIETISIDSNLETKATGMAEATK